MLRKTICLIFLSGFLPFFANASAYWLEIKGAGETNKEVIVELIYGNIDDSGIRHRQQGQELKLAGDFKFNLITPTGEQISMKLILKSDCWSFSFRPKDKGTYRIIGFNNQHPVIDRTKTGGESILPIDYLCAQYLVGDGQTSLSAQQFLDITTKKQGKLIRVNAFVDYKPSKFGTRLRVFNPQNWERELTLDDKGEAIFMPTMRGMYIVRQDFVESKAGIFNNVKYTSIRYRCNCCLFISGKTQL